MSDNNDDEHIQSPSDVNIRYLIEQGFLDPATFQHPAQAGSNATNICQTSKLWKSDLDQTMVAFFSDIEFPLQFVYHAKRLDMLSTLQECHNILTGISYSKTNTTLPQDCIKKLTNVLVSASFQGHIITLVFCQQIKLNLMLEFNGEEQRNIILQIQNQADELPTHFNEVRFFSRNPTALHAAARRGHVNCMKFLLAQGADVNSLNAVGLCPLHHAVLSGNFTAVDLLCTHNAAVTIIAADDVELEEDKCGTALHIAARYASLEIVHRLLEAGADVDTPNKYGNTALHIACKHRTSSDIAKLLIDHGADITAENANGQTPLDLITHKDLKDEIAMYQPSSRNCKC